MQRWTPCWIDPKVKPAVVAKSSTVTPRRPIRQRPSGTGQHPRSLRRTTEPPDRRNANPTSAESNNSQACAQGQESLQTEELRLKREPETGNDGTSKLTATAEILTGELWPVNGDESRVERGNLFDAKEEGNLKSKAGASRICSLEELQSRLQYLLPGFMARDPARPVALLAEVAGERRPLISDADVWELFRSHSSDGSVDIEIRPLFPAASATEPSNQGVSGAPCVVTVPVSSHVINVASVSAAASPKQEMYQIQEISPKGHTSLTQGTTLETKPPWTYRKVSSPVPYRPLSAPPCPPRRRGDNNGDAQKPTYDGRPGRRLDGEWGTGGHQFAAQAGVMSAELLEACGLREEYEHLRSESKRRRDLLQNLLQSRDSVPGTHVSIDDSLSPKAARAVAVAAASRGTASTAVHCDWQRGAYCLVASRDIPKLKEAIESLTQIEDLAKVRLQDEGARVTWRISTPTRRIAEERRLAVGRPTFLPRRVLVESQWMKFMDFGQVAFRFLPQGDASSSAEDATLYIWMAEQPPVSFNFCLRIGHDRLGADAVQTAPRFWRRDATHYRVDVDWTQIQVGLMSILDRGEDELEISLVVLQWHGPVPAVDPFLPDQERRGT